MRFLLTLVFFLMVISTVARADDTTPSTDEYKNVKPGLLTDTTAPLPEAAAPEAATEEQPEEAETQTMTMKLEDLVGAYHQGKFDTVAKNIMPLADNGYHEAEEILGLMYKSGQGVEKKTDKAILWLTKAAEAGRPLAEHYLGAMYYSGEGVSLDRARALLWLQLAVIHYPDGPEKNRAAEDLKNLSAQSLRRERESAADMVQEWLDNKGEKTPPSPQQSPAPEQPPPPPPAPPEPPKN